MESKKIITAGDFVVLHIHVIREPDDRGYLQYAQYSGNIEDDVNTTTDISLIRLEKEIIR